MAFAAQVAASGSTASSSTTGRASEEGTCRYRALLEEKLQTGCACLTAAKRTTLAEPPRHSAPPAARMTSVHAEQRRSAAAAGSFGFRPHPRLRHVAMRLATSAKKRV